MIEKKRIEETKKEFRKTFLPNGKQYTFSGFFGNGDNYSLNTEELWEWIEEKLRQSWSQGNLAAEKEYEEGWNDAIKKLGKE